MAILTNFFASGTDIYFRFVLSTTSTLQRMDTCVSHLTIEIELSKSLTSHSVRRRQTEVVAPGSVNHDLEFCEISKKCTAVHN